MRAMAAAILLFVLNLIGLGIGPWFVGYLSDEADKTTLFQFLDRVWPKTTKHEIDQTVRQAPELDDSPAKLSEVRDALVESEVLH